MSHTMIKKTAFATALKELLQKQPFSKISVTDICKECGVSRKSFYYHFKDKHDLVDWIFYTECATPIEEENITEFWIFYKKLATYIYENRHYFIDLFKVEGAFSFRNTLTVFMTRNFIKYIHNYFEDNDDYSSQEKRDDCLDFLSATFIASVVNWITNHPHLTPEQFIEVIKFDKLIST
ncbi:MAG: TetR family transcriptional regulator [Coprobacillaceae bacterium]